MRIEHEFVAMGGPARLRMDCADQQQAQRAIAAATSDVQRLEKKYSRYLETSVTSRINRRAGTGQAVEIDEETASLLSYANTVWQHSDGMFDLTSGILRKAWDFKSNRIPQQQELDKLLPCIGWDNVEWDQQRIHLPIEGMELDFGGCVKEYACDSVVNVLLRLGVQHALIDLAGDMAATGPQQNGEAWLIGIQRPEEKNHAIADIELTRGGLASSGNYARRMTVEGRHFGHILNPGTGWPIEGLAAVSVMAEQCLVAGSAATIAMLKPESQALEWLEQLGLPWFAIDTQLQCHGRISQ
jgi:thiamine biosynthesis lipoprotein